MARSDLTLNVGTKYHDEGLKKLGGAMKNTTKTVADASRVVGSLSSELQGLSGKAGQAAGAIGGLFQALMSGGPIALIITGITTAVSFLVKAFTDAKDRAREAGKAMAESMKNAAKAISDSAQNAITNLQKQFDLMRQMRQLEKEGRDIDARDAANTIRQEGMDERRQLKEEGYGANSAQMMRSKAEEQRQLAELTVQSNFDSKQQAHRDAGSNVSTLRAQLMELEGARVQIEASLEQLNNTRAGRKLAKQQAKVLVAKEAMESDPTNYKAFRNWADEEDKLKRFRTDEDKFKNTYDAQQEYKKQMEETAKKIKDLKDKIEVAEEAENTALQDFLVAQEERDTALKDIAEKYKEQMEKIDEAQDKYNAEVVKAGKKIGESAAKMLADRRAAQEKREADATKAGKKLGEAGVKLWGNKRKADEAAEAKEIKTIRAGRELGEKLAKSLRDSNAEHEKEKEAAKKLADEERRVADILAQWNANPNQNFNAWNAGQQGAQRDADKAAAQRQRNIQQAQDQANAVGGRIFNKDGSLRRGANAFDVGRFAELSDYLGFENVKDDKGRMDAMRGMRDKLQNKLFNKDGTLKKGVNPLGRDMGLFKKLDGSLKKFDAANKPKKTAGDKIFDLLKTTLPKMGL